MGAFERMIEIWYATLGYMFVRNIIFIQFNLKGPVSIACITFYIQFIKTNEPIAINHFVLFFCK